MTAVILNVKEYIDTDRPDLSDWLDMATNHEKEALQLRHGNAATDGVRIHAADAGRDCNCNNPQDIHGKINHIMDIAENECKLAFLIDRQLLIDALAGMEEGAIVFYCGTPTQPIVLEEADGSRYAVIMPLQPKEERRQTPDIPRVKTEKAEAPQPDDYLFEV
jgi:hypothetical protein